MNSPQPTSATAIKSSLIVLFTAVVLPLLAFGQSGAMMMRLMRNIDGYMFHGVRLDIVRNNIVSVIEEDMKKRGDGTSLIGTFVRLSWHCSGTYSKSDNTGGSQGARIRFAPEKNWEANAGLDIPMKALESVKEMHPKMSYADLYTYAGVVSAEYAGSNFIPYKLGRLDFEDGEQSLQEERLPDADKGSVNKTSQHMRDVFHRMGFTDKEMVCLIGAHTLGRCHIDRSGYWGPWNKAENKFNNALFSFLLDMKWTPKKEHEGKPWNGPLQYENPTGELMMLPSCMAMIEDKAMKEYVTMYARDKELFLKDFSAAFGKLLALGVPERKRFCFGIFC